MLGKNTTVDYRQDEFKDETYNSLNTSISDNRYSQTVDPYRNTFSEKFALCSKSKKTKLRVLVSKNTTIIDEKDEFYDLLYEPFEVCFDLMTCEKISHKIKLAKGQD